MIGRGYHHRHFAHPCPYKSGSVLPRFRRGQMSLDIQSWSWLWGRIELNNELFVISYSYMGGLGKISHLDLMWFVV